jgi:CheY-like chemotaxis protein
VRPRRILAVDDEPTLVHMLAAMLEHDGHTVAAATSGAAALERLAAEPFDVLLADVSMPHMSGWELARAVRARHPATVIVLATGWGAGIGLEQARAEGVSAVVAKPYRLAHLRSALAALPEPTAATAPLG